MIGDWTGTFAVSRLLDDGTARVNVCDQSWMIADQTDGQFSGSFQLSGGSHDSCSQTGAISGTVLTDGTVLALFATLTSPRLPCVITARSGIMGSVADGRLRAEWFEQGVCESGSLSRSILVEMTKG
jgi:hypothetical protein